MVSTKVLYTVIGYRSSDMTTEIVFDDRSDPSQIIRSNIDRRAVGAPKYAKISFDGGKTFHKVPFSLTGLYKERSHLRRQIDLVRLRQIELYNS